MKNKIIVIGGLSAGPSAAAKARRENEKAEIILFEKSPNISYATCGIPYALSGVIPSRDKLLVVEADLLRDRFNIDVRLGEEVLDILPEKKQIVTTKDVYDYDSLVFTTGARPNVPPIKNLNQALNWSTCRSLADFDKIMKEGILDSVKNITVLGSGLIGVEVAENIAELGKSVTLIEGNTQILPMWQPKFSNIAQKELERHQIKVITGHYAKAFITEKDVIKQIDLGNGEQIDTDFVIVSTGIKPNTEILLNKGAEALPNGALKVNEKMETSIKDIYAAGDNVSVKNLLTDEFDYFPLGTHSNKGGRTAGANAAGGNEIFKGAYKTAIIKIFDFTLARTGLNKKDLDKLGWEYKTNLIITGSTPGYYPGQKDIIIEIYYNPTNERIYGAEIYGEKGVDKRIDVLSTAIYAKLKMTDLQHLDLAYAPPYAPAKDPVIVNGFVSSNAFNKNYTEISMEELIEDIVNKKDIQLIDVRAINELNVKGKISNAIHIDLHELRSKLNELDKNKETIVYCARGLRGYVASRILTHNGFKNVKNLSGGFTIWQMHNHESMIHAH
jgi:NADPH-dependent 2,4-dienoyl-CoA reductase/sulfur reductase-like enzyme/rhodanese-related sulfurtransferase